MKASIAVATVSGKAYYLIVSELRRKSISFLSLTPSESVPVEVRVVITTEKEKHLISHGKILTYIDGADIEAMVNQALRIVQGKETYENLIIGIDPGEVLGLAVLVDGKVIETQNCFSVEETLDKVRNLLRNIGGTPGASVSVKVGDGAPACKDELLHALDQALPHSVILESVSEAGTSHPLNESKHRRGLRDMVSAIRIAGRNGHTYERGKSE